METASKKKIEQYLADDETGGKEEKKTETKMQLEPPKNYDFAAAIKRRRGIILNYEISVTMAKRSLLNVIQKWAKFIKVELPFPGIEGSGKKGNLIKNYFHFYDRSSLQRNPIKTVDLGCSG